MPNEQSLPRYSFILRLRSRTIGGPGEYGWEGTIEMVPFDEHMKVKPRGFNRLDQMPARIEQILATINPGNRQ